MGGWRIFLAVGAALVAAPIGEWCGPGSAWRGVRAETSAPEPAPAAGGLLARPRLSGDWGGLRPALAERGVEIDLLYTLDVLGTVSGGLGRGVDVLGNADLTLAADLEALLGWPGARAFLYGLGTHGGDPSDRVGDVQIVDNIEAFDTWKLFEAWLEQSFADGAASLRAGLYAVDAEFDVLPSAGLLLNSSFGTGADLGSSGRNGPSIFPVTSLAARVELRPRDALYARAVVADGVPGEPGAPRGTRVRFASGDGVFLAGEAGVLNLPDPAHRPPPLRPREMPPPGEQRYGHFGKLAVGAWGYTSELERFVTGPGGDPRTRRGTWGVYALAEQSVFFERADPRQGLSLFARAGLADEAVNPVDAYLGAGLVYRGPLPGRGADRVSFGVAAAHLAEPFRESLATAARRSEPWEVALELTWLVRLAPGLELQPDVQLVVDPGSAPGIPDAWVVGGRLLASF